METASQILCVPYSPVINHRGVLLGTPEPMRGRFLDGLVDPDGDGVFEIVSHEDGIRGCLSILSVSGQASHVLTLRHPPSAHGEVLLVPLGRQDKKVWLINEDLRHLWDNRGAGSQLVCYDLDGKVRWCLPCGPDILMEAVAELDGSGDNELVCGTRSEETGAEGGGFSDLSHAYVFVVDAKGQIRWRVSFCGLGGKPEHAGSSGVDPCRRVADPGLTRRRVKHMCVRAGAADLDGDGTTEVVVIGGSWNHDWGKMVILRGRDGQLLHDFPLGSSCDYSFTTFGIGDLDGDGKKEIVTGSTNGYLRVFNCQGELIGDYSAAIPTTRWDSIVMDIWAISDLDGDGNLEVLASSTAERKICRDSRYYLSEFSENRLLVVGFDPDRHVLAEKTSVPLGQRCQRAIVADLIRGGPNEIIALTDQVEVYGAVE